MSIHTLELELEAGRLVILDVEGFPIQRHWYLVTCTGKRLPRGAGILRLPDGRGCRDADAAWQSVMRRAVFSPVFVCWSQVPVARFRHCKRPTASGNFRSPVTTATCLVSAILAVACESPGKW